MRSSIPDVPSSLAGQVQRGAVSRLMECLDGVRSSAFYSLRDVLLIINWFSSWIHRNFYQQYSNLPICLWRAGDL